MALRYHEGKAIDAVLQRIGAREGSTRRDDGRSPDDLGDPDPQRRVEYVCTVGSTLYAFEHTGIEPFGNQIEMEVRNQTLFAPIVGRFDAGSSDEEFWELYVPVEASMTLTGTELTRVRDALIRWIETNAANFPLARYGDKFRNPVLGERVADVPFPVSLQRWSLNDLVNGKSPLCGRFGIRPVVTVDLENERVARLRKSVKDKFPKLAKWKHADGARTVLVLEENDLSLTNHQLVANSMSVAEAELPDPLDETFLVTTAIADCWWVTCLRREGRTYYDDGERFHQFDPATLTKLTKRWSRARRLTCIRAAGPCSGMPRHRPSGAVIGVILGVTTRFVRNRTLSRKMCEIRSFHKRPFGISDFSQGCDRAHRRGKQRIWHALAIWPV